MSHPDASPPACHFVQGFGLKAVGGRAAPAAVLGFGRFYDLGFWALGFRDVGFWDLEFWDLGFRDGLQESWQAINRATSFYPKDFGEQSHPGPCLGSFGVRRLGVVALVSDFLGFEFRIGFLKRQESSLNPKPSTLNPSIAQNNRTLPVSRSTMENYSLAEAFLQTSRLSRSNSRV